MNIRNARVSTRLGVAFGAIVLLLLAVVLVSLWGTTVQRHDADQFVRAAEVSDTVEQMRFLGAQANSSKNEYALRTLFGGSGGDRASGDARAILDATLSEFEAALASLEADVSSEAERATAAAVRTELGRFVALDAEIVELLGDGSSGSDERALELVVGEATEAYVALEAALDRWNDLAHAERDAADQDSAATADRTRAIIIAAGAASVVVAAALALLITRSITRPLQETVRVLDDVRAGDLSPRVDDAARDEVGSMGRALNGTLERVSSVVAGIADGAATLSASSEELSAVSQQMSSGAEETAAQAATVSSAAEQVSHNLQSVSAATEELDASIQEIAKNTSDAARVAATAVRSAELTSATMAQLGASASEIDDVVKVINSIAQQTHLLAINATIEAARAGEAGKGFAVVASEVKDLARKTAVSSEEIGRKVGSIQTDTERAVASIDEITTIIRDINDIQTVIAASVEEQAATTSEIGRSVSEAALGSTEIARNITGVAETAQANTHGAVDTHRAAEELARLAGELLGLVGQFRLGPAQPHDGAPHQPGDTLTARLGERPLWRGDEGTSPAPNGRAPATASRR